MTPESRLGVLNGLLERVWRNAREPRPSFLEFWDRPAGKRPFRPRPVRAKEPVAPQTNGREDFLLDSVESAPPPTAPGRGREAVLTFGDESTQTGDPVEAERLVLLEQEEAARQARPPSAPPTPRSPVAQPAHRGGDAPDDDDGSLVIDDFELSGPDPIGDASGPATQPPGAVEALPDVEAIENDALDVPDAFDADEPFLRADPRATLTNEAALERARAESLRPSEPKPTANVLVPPREGALKLPPPPRAPAPPPPPPPVSGLELRDDDEVPSSVRKPVQLDRPVDDAFDGFGPVIPPSEPPPESGEVPSQRRLLTPPRFDAVSGPDPDAIDVHLDSVPPAVDAVAAPARGVSTAPPGAPAAALGSGLPRLGADDDDDDFAGKTSLFRKSERPFADEVAAAAAATSGAAQEDDEDDYDDDAEDDAALAEAEADATKEIRTMGRVDVIERQPIAPAEVIVLSESRQKSPSSFGDLLDLALSIGP